MIFAPVVDHLRNNGVVGYPTETVYGLGSACTQVGMRALQMVKGRSEEKSFIALVASRESIAGLAWTEEAVAAGRHVLAGFRDAGARRS